MTSQSSLFDNAVLCPLDGRYREDTRALLPYFSEEALIRARLFVEIHYLNELSKLGLPELSSLPEVTFQALHSLVGQFSSSDMARVREIERETRHDVKALEYWFREVCGEKGITVPLHFFHFGLTSEDVTNLAYGTLIRDFLKERLIPLLHRVAEALPILATQQASKDPEDIEGFIDPVDMLGMTHGQPATPTTVCDQVLVFHERLESLQARLQSFKMNGKFGGAVGNLAAHYAAHPTVDWRAFSQRFVEGLDLRPLHFTKQINSHDDIAHLCHLMGEVSTVLLDLCQDMWLYISRGVFREKAKEGEVGSSTMPNKVNPINWENAEGNLGISRALCNFFADKLPISRMQRDLSDSTVQRWLGCMFGAHVLALHSILRGLRKVEIDQNRLAVELQVHPEVHAEAIQTVMRCHGYDDAYEQVKALTRGREVTAELLINFVRSLDRVPTEKREQLCTRILPDS